MGVQSIESEMENDFRQGVVRLGYDVEDFGISRSARRDLQLGGGQYAVRQLVRVKRASTNAVKEYEAGHGRAWAADALRDVEMGQFGKP